MTSETDDNGTNERMEQPKTQFTRSRTDPKGGLVKPSCSAGVTSMAVAFLKLLGERLGAWGVC